MAESSRFTHLLEEARLGSREAFSKLCTKAAQDRWLKLIIYLLPRRLRSKVDPEDVLQDVRQKAWEGISSVRGEGMPGFHTWVAGIARHQVETEIRRYSAKKRDVGIEEDRHMSSDSGVIRDSHTAIKSSMRREHATKIAEVLELLEPSKREVIVRCILEGYSREEVAEMMNKKPDHVSVLRHRALAELRDLLKARGISSTIFRMR